MARGNTRRGGGRGRGRGGRRGQGRRLSPSIAPDEPSVPAWLLPPRGEVGVDINPMTGMPFDPENDDHDTAPLADTSASNANGDDDDDDNDDATAHDGADGGGVDNSLGAQQQQEAEASTHRASRKRSLRDIIAAGTAALSPSAHSLRLFALSTYIRPSAVRCIGKWTSTEAQLPYWMKACILASQWLYHMSRDARCTYSFFT